MKRKTLFSCFLRETKLMLVTSCFAIALPMIQSLSAETITAIAGLANPATNIYDAAAWPNGTLPVLRDGNIWSTGKFRLSVTTKSCTFFGGTLNIANGGILSINVPSTTVKINNLTLNGGIIQESSSSVVTVDLQTKTFTLNSGAIKTTSVSEAYKNLLFANGSLAGSGTITIAQIQSGTYGYYVEFLSSVNTTGFKGKFEIAPGLNANSAGGTLKLNAISPANASFGVNVLAPAAPGGVTSNVTLYKSTLNGKLFYTADPTATVALTSLTLGGAVLASGTYGLTAGKEIIVFTTAQQAYIDSRSSGTITVIGAKK